MSKQLRVLILEDNPADYVLVKRELRKAGLHFTERWAQDQPTFIQALEESTPDLILLDYSLPGFDGMDALALVRQRFSETPTIIVSGVIGEETAVEMLKAGADDYVLKQRLIRLGPVVHHALQQAKEKKSQAHAREPESAAKQLRILILEDNPSDVELMKLELRKAGFNFTARWAQNQQSFKQALDELTPDIVLADYSLPGFDGMHAVSLVRQRFKEVPTIIVSGFIGEETAIETLKSGATDYVLKTRLSRLGPVVSRALHETQEIIRRKQAQEALRETSQRLTSIVENSPLAMIEWDTDNKIVRWTNEAKRAFGWTVDDMLGKRIDDVHLFHEEDWADVEHMMADMKAGHCPRNILTSRNYRKDNSVIWCEWYNSALCDTNGKLEGIVSLALDVTEKIEAQKTLQTHVHLLQQAILPAEPRVGPGYAVASHYFPAYTGQDVGGDFYDVFETEAGKMGILIGDVSGKGIPAAALAAVARSTVRAFEFEMFSTGEALTHANKVLYSYSGEDDGFVTIQLTVLDPASGKMRYSNAGHPPPAIYRAGSGNIEWLMQGDVPVRIAEIYDFQEAVTDMQPGDKILFYTDGLIEARNEVQLFGMEGVERTLKECGQQSPETIVDHLVQAARNWGGGRLRDDTAIIVIEREAA